MTDEKKPFSEYLLESFDKIDGAIRKDNPAFYKFWQIACIMRSAAGLSYSDTPASGWREDGTPDILIIVGRIIFAARGPKWDRPESVSKELYKLRYSLRDLRRQLSSIDELTMYLINQYADPIRQQQVTITDWDEYTNEEIGEIARSNSELQFKLSSPDHQMPIEAALEQMDRLEEGLTRTLEDVEEDARARADMGQLRTYAAKQVALGVAEYMHRVNGKIPGLWTGGSPSGPYAKAVLEIFDLLDIPRGSLQRAGEYATAKLRSDPEF